LAISVVVLTFNSAPSIARTLRSVQAISDDIHVVDSFSQDDTVAICEAMGCKVVQHPFDNYAAQRNWAIDTLPLAHEWQLHVDADEELEPALQDALKRADLTGAAADGYIIGRKIVFLGKVLKYGSVNKTWHYRLFRRGFGRCENRLYDQHFVASGRTETIDAFMLDHQEMSIGEWTARHNRWSDAEAAEMLLAEAETKREGQVEADPRGNPIQRRRHAKKRYYTLPLFWRAFLYTFYRYIICLGFLDGKPGLIYHFLQGFWFRFLVDAKMYERRLNDKAAREAR
jgi:glycosyltransferase involved in cell wall biosynthesis